MVFSILALLCAVAAVEGAVQTVYLSVFGSDNNDGSSPQSAVASLTRAMQLAQGVSSSNQPEIQMAPGVLPLGSPPTVTRSVVIRGAAPGQNPALYQFSCSSSGEQLSVGGASLGLVGILITGCNQAVTVGIGYYTSSQSLNLDTVQFAGNNVDLVAGEGTVNIVTQRTAFAGKVRALQFYCRYTSYCRFAGSFANSTFVAGSASTIDTTNQAGSAAYVTGSLSFAYSKFTAQAGATPPFVAVNGFQVQLDHVSFVGPTSTPNCGVVLSNNKASISDTFFDSHTGAPALCIINAIVNVVNSDFAHNAGNTSVTSTYPGAGIYMTGSTVGVSNSNFQSNTVTAADGAGIHCENSRLTVGSSTFSYNKADTAAASSCFACTVVSFNNTQTRNQQQAPGNSCNLM